MSETNNRKQESVIVTGANGYVGRYICRELLIKGYDVISFTYDHFASALIKHDHIRYVRVDIRQTILDQPGVRELVSNKNIKAIINAAALLGSPDFDDNYAVNAHGVETIIDLAKELGIDHIVQLSSVVVLKKIKGPYGLTKLDGQDILIDSDIDHTIFIPAVILGPESLGLNRVLKNVLRFPLFVPLIGNGSQSQHPIFIYDVAKYAVLAIEKDISRNKIYEIANDTILSFKQLILRILKIKNKKRFFLPVPVFVAKMLGKIFQSVQKVPLFTEEHVKGVLQDTRLDTSLIKKDLSFEPTSLDKALTDSMNVIGNNWSDYLTPKPEREIELESLNF